MTSVTGDGGVSLTPDSLPLGVQVPCGLANLSNLTKATIAMNGSPVVLLLLLILIVLIIGLFVI